jgi:hypothetical protein
VPPAAPAKRTPPPIPPPAHLLSPTYISKVKDNCQAITTAFR